MSFDLKKENILLLSLALSLIALLGSSLIIADYTLFQSMISENITIEEPYAPGEFKISLHYNEKCFIDEYTDINVKISVSLSNTTWDEFSTLDIMIFAIDSLSLSQIASNGINFRQDIENLQNTSDSLNSSGIIKINIRGNNILKASLIYIRIVIFFHPAYNSYYSNLTDFSPMIPDFNKFLTPPQLIRFFPLILLITVSLLIMVIIKKKKERK